MTAALVIALIAWHSHRSAVAPRALVKADSLSATSAASPTLSSAIENPTAGDRAAQAKAVLTPAEHNIGLAIGYAISGRWEKQARVRLACE